MDDPLVISSYLRDVNIPAPISKILLKSGTKFTINAKSLLGVIYAKKLNWSDIKLICDFDYYREFEKFIVTEDPIVVEDN